MPDRQKSTRTRLIEAALALFASKGITETTTKAVAERARVNEVTLFRHFGSKQGLLLAVLEETEALARERESADREVVFERESLVETFEEMAELRLQSLERVPELVRSLIAEAGQSPEETRQALGRLLSEGNRYAAERFAIALERTHCTNALPLATLASLFNTILLGYFLIESTSEGHQLWAGRQDAIASIVQLFLQGAIGARTPVPSVESISELPASLVHLLLQRARARSRNDGAWMYLLFAAGLSPEEIARLTRSSTICEPHQCLLQINLPNPRQVPLNSRILGKRYGTNTNNPLTQWLKSRKDSETALFLNEAGQPLSAVELRHKWQVLASEMLAPEGHPPKIEQARQTWCVEMLAKGIDLEDLSILSGLEVEQLQPYARRVREKAAIERATRLDRGEGGTG